MLNLNNSKTKKVLIKSYKKNNKKLYSVNFYTDNILDMSIRGFEYYIHALMSSKSFKNDAVIEETNPQNKSK